MKNEEIWYWHFFLSHCWLLTYNSTCATHILSVNSHFFIDDESKTNLSEVDGQYLWCEHGHKVRSERAVLGLHRRGELRGVAESVKNMVLGSEERECEPFARMHIRIL